MGQLLRKTVRSIAIKNTPELLLYIAFNSFFSG